jgi:hypothetical protein
MLVVWNTFAEADHCHGDGSQRFVEGRRENEAGDEDGSKDENEGGDGQSGLEHAHDELSWVLRGTQYGNNRRHSLAFLVTQIWSVDNLNDA